MKPLFALLALVFALLVAAPSVLAQALTDGQITRVDTAAGKITIKHGPMKKFGMDEGMTMVYRAQDPALLTTVKAGDKVKFDAEQVNGQYVVTRIEKAK